MAGVTSLSLAVIALYGQPIAAQGSVPGSPPAPSAMPTPSPLPGSTVLRGTITGSHEAGNGQYSKTQQMFRTSMDLTLSLAPDRAHIWGTGEFFGEFTGDCQFSDGGALTIDVDPFDSAMPTEGEPTVSIGLLPSELAQVPLAVLHLYVGVAGAEYGGSCNHVFGGPLEDAFPAARVTLAACTGIEIVREAGSWRGACSTQEGTPGDDLDYWFRESWTADFVQEGG
jgi:hypothetical protein